MITNCFIPELNNHDVQELWFQQDGATRHTARATIDLLKDTFGDRLISRFGSVNWPPRSCDLTPLDYFLWGYFFFDKRENVSQALEIVNDIYGADTVTVNYVQFWFHRLRSVTFDVKDSPHIGRPFVENIDKITEIIEVDRHVCSRRIIQELKINHQTVLNHLRKVGLKKKLAVRVPYQLTPKNMMDQISICEALAKRNESMILLSILKKKRF
ncbi:histone-lysine N-methyltransferase SETMAR [Trichonephila clavipes]|nr:histone-lysine N-methyltransferase SETMAR [Trichonephila clavipes]